MKKRFVINLSLLALIIILSREGEVRAQKIKERLAHKAILDGLKNGGGTIAATQTATMGHRHHAPHRRAGRDTLQSMVLSVAARHQVNPRLLWTIAYLETKAHSAPHHVRRTRHLTARKLEATASHLRQLTIRFNERPELLLASFHAGESAVEAYLNGRAVQLTNGQVINPRQQKTAGVPPYCTTQKYVARGLRLYARLAQKNLFPMSATESTASEIKRPRELLTIPRTITIKLGEFTDAPPNVLAATRQRTVGALPAMEENLFTEEDLFFDPHSGERFIVGTSAEDQTNEGAIMSAALEAPQRIASPQDDGSPTQTFHSSTRVRTVYGNAFGN